MWRKELLALGLYDPDSPLRVRLLTWDGTFPDSHWAQGLAAAAAALRRSDPRLAVCDGVRLLHGEGDWTPGLVLDAYAGTGVAAFDGPACEAFWRPRLGGVVAGLASGGFALRGVVEKGGGQLLWGEAPPREPLVISENGVRYEVDVRRGHKTGFFLDQRECRRRVRELAGGQEVLDLFSYTGGFAVSAAVGGASRVVAVDQAAPAVKACRRNFELNGLAATEEGAELGRHRLHVADCWDFLREAAARGERFDIVVNDPPSMAPSARARDRALKAYAQLNQLALAVVRPGGLLLTCSCSSHVSGQDLRRAVEEAGRAAARPLVLEAQERAATDHPVRRGFAEGDYLQALYVRVH